MPRTLDSDALAALADPVTAPGYLIAITSTAGQVLRYSTRGTIEHDGQTWIGGGRIVRQSPTDWDVAMPNHDNAASALALGSELDHATANVWAYLGQATPPQAILLFEGYVNEVLRITAATVEFSLAAVTLGRSWLPDILLAPPLLNHLPPPGTAISWGGKTYYLEANA